MLVALLALTCATDCPTEYPATLDSPIDLNSCIKDFNGATERPFEINETTSEITITMTRCKFSNVLTSENGGLIMLKFNSIITVSDCEFNKIKNSGGSLHGGVFYLEKCAFSIAKSQINECSSDYSGSFLYLQTTQKLIIDACTLLKCENTGGTSDGGSINFKHLDGKGNATITDTIFERCDVGCTLKVIATIINCTFKENSYSKAKSSLFLNAGKNAISYTISECLFIKNQPGGITITPSISGAVTYTIENCEFREQDGSDISVTANSNKLIFVNCTFIKSSQTASISTSGSSTGSLNFEGCCFQYITEGPTDGIFYISKTGTKEWTATFSSDNCVDLPKSCINGLTSKLTAPDSIFECKAGCGIELPKESEIIYSEIVNPAGCPTVPNTVNSDQHYDGCAYTRETITLFTITSGDLTLEKCSFRGCKGPSTSGNIISATTETALKSMIIIDCSFENSYPNVNEGGMIYVTSTLESLNFTGNTIDNTSPSFLITGLAIYATKTKQMNISSCVVINSGYEATLSTSGGIFYSSDADSIVLVEDNKFEKCKRCLVINCKELNVISTSFTDCLDFYGSCVLVNHNAKVNIGLCNFTSCSAENGATGDNKQTGGAVSIISATELTIDHCNFHKCEAKYGGGFYCDSIGKLVISNNNFVECNAGSGGVLEETKTSVSAEFVSNTFIDNKMNVDGSSITLYIAIKPAIKYIIKDNTFSGSGQEIKFSDKTNSHEISFVNNHFEKKGAKASILGELGSLILEKNCFTFGTGADQTTPFIEIAKETSTIELKDDNCFASKLNVAIKFGNEVQYNNWGIFECTNCKDVPFIQKPSDEPTPLVSETAEIQKSYVDIGCPVVFPYSFTEEATLEDCSYEGKNEKLFTYDGGNLLTINRCNFTNIQTQVKGSILNCEGITTEYKIVIKESAFKKCVSTVEGGIAYIAGSAGLGSLTISDIQVIECKASNAYGFYVKYHNVVKVSNSQVSNCEDTDNKLENRKIGFIGSTYSSSNTEFNIDNCEFSTCQDSVLSIIFPNFVVQNCVFKEIKISGGNYGVIYIPSYSAVMNGNINSCEFIGNTYVETNRRGICIALNKWEKRDLILSNCNFTDNVGDSLIYASNAATFTLTFNNCNFNDNTPTTTTLSIGSSSTIALNKCCLQTKSTETPFAVTQSGGKLVFDAECCVKWTKENVGSSATIEGPNTVFECNDCIAGPPPPPPPKSDEPPAEPSVIINPEGCPSGSTEISTESTFTSCNYNHGNDMFKLTANVKLTLQNCEFSTITSTSGGCVIFSDITSIGNVKVDNCEFNNCEGGIVKITSTVAKFELLNSRINGQSVSTVDGYGVYLTNAVEFDVNGCTFKVNQKETSNVLEYGGIFYTDGTGSMKIEGSAFDTCSRCVVGRNSNIEVKNTDFTSCSDLYGSAIYIPSNRDDASKNVNELSIIGCKFIKCVSNKGIISKGGQSGGAITIYSATTLSVNGSLFEECVANYAGGLYFSKCSTVLIAENTFTKCSAYNGGGLEDAGTKTSLLIYNNTFKENVLASNARGASICLFGSPAPTDLSKIEMNTFINGQSDIFINPNKGTRTGDIIINNTFTKSGAQPSIECYSLQLTLDNNCFKSNPGATGEVKGFYLYESDPTSNPSVITIKANNCFDKTHAESIKSKGDNSETQIIVENENVFGCNTCYSGVEPQPPLSEKPEDIGGQTKEGTDIPPGGIAGIVIAAIVVVVVIVVVAVVCSKKKGGGHSDYIANNAEEL